VLEVLARSEMSVAIAIWNPDGSKAELSGNGTRIAAAWLAEQTGGSEVTVEVAGRIVHTRLRSSGDIEQELGEVEIGVSETVDGVTFVPALAGLGSPWWDADARGLVAGITRGTTRAHLVRAALEGIAHQVADVVDALPRPPVALRVDGGATKNGFLMQFQADLLRMPVEVAAEQETTALGAAALAAGQDARGAVRTVYAPQRSQDEVATLRAAWRTALERAKTGELA